VHVFVAQVSADSEPTLDPVEHDQHCWMDYDGAMNRLHWWDDKESLKRVDAFLDEGV